MAHEIETKVRVLRFDGLRRRLIGLGATPEPRMVETNLMYDRLCGDLKQKGCRLRLRMLREAEGGDGPVVMTFKGPKRIMGALKARREIEVTVSCAEQMQTMLTAMGYRCTFRYEKRRESWRLGPVRVELDHVPLLGRFVEVEAPIPGQVHAVLADLSLDHLPKLKRGYVSMLRRHLKSLGEDDAAGLPVRVAA